MPKIFKCPYCDTPPQRMRDDAKTCGEWKCQKRHQRKMDSEKQQLDEELVKHEFLRDCGEA